MFGAEALRTMYEKVLSYGLPMHQMIYWTKWHDNFATLDRTYIGSSSITISSDSIT